MPTRFYLPSSGAAAVTLPAPDWFNSTATDVHPWPPGKSNTAYASKSETEISSTNGINLLLKRYVSAPLAAQTISGQVRGVVRALESSTSMNAFAQMRVRVYSNDGQTIRATVLDRHTNSLSSEYGTALANRKHPLTATNTDTNGTPLTSYTCVAGDRLVLEIGLRVANTSTSSFTGTHEYGDPVAGTDLVFDDAGTAQGVPWVEFTQAIAFPPTTDLVDNFATQDTVKWGGWSANAAHDAEQLKITLTSAYPNLFSMGRYDFRGSTISAKYAQVPNIGAGSTQMGLRAQLDPNNEVEVIWEDNELRLRNKVNDVNTDSARIAFTADTAYVRLRESAGTVFLDTSPDGAAWTLGRQSIATALDLSSVEVRLRAGFFGTETDPGIARFDNFNFNPAAKTVVGASRGTTWRAAAPVVATRATTWDATAPVVASRASAWDAGSTVAGSRSSSWRASSVVTASRGSTWTSTVTVPASRATAWDAGAAVSAARPSTWTSRAAVSANRPSTWQTQASVGAIRSSSWRVVSPVAATRSSTWAVGSSSTSVVVTRATAWALDATVVAVRGTAWQTRTTTVTARSSAWDVASTVSTARAASWRVTALTLALRSATWRSGGQVGAARGTGWIAYSDVGTEQPTSAPVLRPAGIVTAQPAALATSRPSVLATTRPATGTTPRT